MSERDSSGENGAPRAPAENNSEAVEEVQDVETVPAVKTERPVYDGPALPLRRVEVQEGGSFVPEPTREDEDGNKVHTSISEKWKVYDSEPVPWTQEERQEYTDSMPIHPLFMDEEDFKNPEMVENNPALDAINKLIDSASPKARAEQCKLDGNQFFEVAQKEKKVRAKREDNMDLALKAYKRGSKFCNDAIKALGHQGSAELVELLSLSSTLHTNSAVVHMARGNLQTAVSECKVAIKIYAGNIKAYWRAAKASLEMGKLDDAMAFCSQALFRAKDMEIEEATHKQCVAVVKLRKKVELAREKRRKREQAEQAALAEARAKQERLEQAIAKRGVGEIQQYLFASMAEYKDAKPYFDEKEDELHWPVLLLYPEHEQSDFIRDVSEFHAISDHLTAMFPTDGPFLPWDRNHQYEHGELVVYFREYAVTRQHDKPEEQRYVIVAPGLCLRLQFESKNMFDQTSCYIG
eukprot:INCI18044.2.p1 GENE.INCI18044.2~~INCI18044.2.p1  ORF type:complete len:465 (+),score=100.41 INCI18044.2:70-1464(+)